MFSLVFRCLYIFRGRNKNADIKNCNLILNQITKSIEIQKNAKKIDENLLRRKVEIEFEQRKEVKIDEIKREFKVVILI